MRFGLMADKTYSEGYRDGWESVAGEEPMPEDPTPRRDGDEDDYKTGFQYGESEASIRFRPGTATLPPRPVDKDA
jgi:hypothetical protein